MENLKKIIGIFGGKQGAIWRKLNTGSRDFWGIFLTTYVIGLGGTGRHGLVSQHEGKEFLYFTAF